MAGNEVDRASHHAGRHGFVRPGTGSEALVLARELLKELFDGLLGVHFVAFLKNEEQGTPDRRRIPGHDRSRSEEPEDGCAHPVVSGEKRQAELSAQRQAPVRNRTASELRKLLNQLYGSLDLPRDPRAPVLAPLRAVGEPDLVPGRVGCRPPTP